LSREKKKRTTTRYDDNDSDQIIRAIMSIVLFLHLYNKEKKKKKTHAQLQVLKMMIISNEILTSYKKFDYYKWK
jgi:hypothetical protein